MKLIIFQISLFGHIFHLPKLTAFELCPWSTYLFYRKKLGMFSLHQKVALLAVLPFWGFFYVFLFLHENYLAHITSCVHLTKIMKQVLSKAYFEAWSLARNQNVLIFLFYYLLHIFTLCLCLHLLLLLRLLHRCEPGLIVWLIL